MAVQGSPESGGAHPSPVLEPKAQGVTRKGGQATSSREPELIFKKPERVSNSPGGGNPYSRMWKDVRLALVCPQVVKGSQGRDELRV